MSFKIIEQPIKKLVIHGIDYIPYDIFVKNHAGKEGGSLGWCRGILYTISHFDTSDFLIEQKVKEGISHWNNIEFTIKQKFEPVVRDEFNNEIRVFDFSYDSIIARVIQFIKEKHQGIKK